MSTARVKVGLYGGPAVGKSWLSAKLSLNPLPTRYVSTIGVKTNYFTLPLYRSQGSPTSEQLQNRYPIHFGLIDTSGAAHYRLLAHSYLQETPITVFVVDGTVPLSPAHREFMVKGSTINKSQGCSRLLVVNKVFQEEKELYPDDSALCTEGELTPADIATLACELGVVAKQDILYTSAKENQGIDQLRTRIYEKAKPLYYSEDITVLFEAAEKVLHDESRTLLDEQARDSRNEFKAGLKKAKKRILTDLSQDKIEKQQALQIAKVSFALAQEVARKGGGARESTQMAALTQFSTDPAVLAHIKKSTRFGRIVGMLIGAALGVFIGVMLGAVAGPGAAFAALALGKAGAAAGAALGAMAASWSGHWLGNQFSLWRHPHPLLKMAKAAQGPEPAASTEAVTEALLPLNPTA